MRTRHSLRLQAVLLLALSGALTMPSHHHVRQDAGPIVVNVDHHGHGTQLLDLGDRQVSEAVGVAMPSAPTMGLPAREPEVSFAPRPTPRPLARGHPSRIDQPRAPPLSA